LSEPTAVHADAEVHETPFREFGPPFGVVWIVQDDPFHLSTRAEEAPPLAVKAPTAVQADDDAHDTPLSVLEVALLGGAVA
jgi:hypothetical protein